MLDQLPGRCGPARYPVVVVDDGSADEPADRRRRGPARRDRAAAAAQRRPGRRAQRRARRDRHRAGRVPGQRLRAAAGLDRGARRAPGRPARRRPSRRGSSTSPRGRQRLAVPVRPRSGTRPSAEASTSAAQPARVVRRAGSGMCRPRRCWSAAPRSNQWGRHGGPVRSGAALWRGCRPDLATARSGLADQLRAVGRRCRTTARRAGPACSTRRFRYGTSAAPLARRHPANLAPLVLQPWPALAVAALLARRPAAAAAGCGRGLV